MQSVQLELKVVCDGKLVDAENNSAAAVQGITTKCCPAVWR
jgi:hypothetical protein